MRFVGDLALECFLGRRGELFPLLGLFPGDAGIVQLLGFRRRAFPHRGGRLSVGSRALFRFQRRRERAGLALNPQPYLGGSN